jgi:hypothetical protein
MRKLNNREDFIKFWAEYIRTHRDEKWSKQQNKLINSQIKIAREIYSKNKEISENYIKKIRKSKIEQP